MNVTTPENHYIIDTGLSSVSNFFLRLLWQNAEYKIGTQLTSIGVAFYITPLINAITRVGTLEEKERLYLAFTDPHSLVESHKRGSDGALAKVAVESLRECTNAKARQDRIKKKGLELCDKKIIENDLIEDSLIFIELDEEFDFVPPELNGVIASAVTSKYNRPVLIGRDNGKEIKGSIRSIDTLDMMPLKEFLLESGYMEWVQGHSLAAGFCISNSKTDNLLDWSNKQLKNIDLDTSVWEVDFSLDEETEYNNIYDLIYDLDTYKKYWGKGLEEPLIHVKNIEISLDNVFVLGTKGDTVKIISNGVSYMFFKKTPAEVKEFLANPIMNIEIVGTGNLNVFRGNYTPQITVSDYNITPIALW